MVDPRPASDRIKTRRRMKAKRSKPRTEQLVSAGGVVYRRVDGIVEAVLCGRHVTPQTADNPGGQPSDTATGAIRWSLAKGTPDPGETLEETALREVREETGLEVEINAPIDSIEYWFRRTRRKRPVPQNGPFLPDGSARRGYRPTRPGI